jgi:hypothetical protein
VTGELTVVIVEPDIAVQRRLRGLRPATRGAAGFVAPPSEHLTLGDMADALLVALGKDPLLRLSRSNPVAVASAWLDTAPPPEVVICDAHLLTRRILDEVLAWLATFDTDVMLVGVDSTPAYPRPFVAEFLTYVLGHHGATRIDEADLAARWPEQDQAAADSGEPWPEIPLVAGVRFRRTARDLLEPAAFGRVDERLCATVCDIRSQINAISVKNPTREIAKQLRHRLDAAATTAEFIIDTRAAELAGLSTGFHVKVDSAALAAAAERFPRRGRHVPERLWERLGSYREPAVPATVALFDAELSVDDIAELTVGTVAKTDTGEVAADGPAGRKVLAAEPGAFVLAQRLYREHSGASEADPLFATHRHPRITGSYARATLLRADTDLALRIVPPNGPVRHPSPRDWLRHHGIEIEMLDRADGRSNK